MLLILLSLVTLFPFLPASSNSAQSYDLNKTASVINRNNDSSSKHVDESTEQPILKECLKLTNCNACLSVDDCVWCDSTKSCKVVPSSHFLPLDKSCNDPGTLTKTANWGMCSMDVKTLAISLTVAGLILVLLISCCLVKLCRCASDFLYYLFCCCLCPDMKERKADARLRKLEKHLERQARRQEALIKLRLQSNVPYGTTKGYSQFENTAM